MTFNCCSACLALPQESSFEPAPGALCRWAFVPGCTGNVPHLPPALLLDGLLEDLLALPALNDLLHLVLVRPLPRHCTQSCSGGVSESGDGNESCPGEGAKKDEALASPS